MVKVTITEDEDYPVYDCFVSTRKDDNIYEIPDDKLEWIKKVEEEYKKTQEYLQNIVRNLNGKDVT